MKKNILFITLGLVLTLVAAFLYTSGRAGLSCCKPGSGTAHASLAARPKPSCKLSSEEQMKREELLRTAIFKKIKAVKELDNGYDFTFSEPEEYSAQLLEFVNFERRCCPYFTFGLVFEPGSRAAHLQIYGSAEIKTELKKGLHELDLL